MLVFFDNFARTNIEESMIQRIQTVYLLISALVMSLGTYTTELFSVNGELIMLSHSIYFVLLSGGVAGISLATLFYYKNRKAQVVLNRISTILTFVLIGLILVEFLGQPSEANVKIGLGMLLPLMNVILLVLANRAIMKDEMLVRAADRLR